MKKRYRLFPALLMAFILSLTMSTVAYADTNGTEPKIVQQPDQLILQLGTRWAGVEFELRTDAGIFPVPVVVNESGVLTMDLGGSTTYTLSCIESTIPIPDPEQDLPQAPEQTEPPEPAPSSPVPDIPQTIEQKGPSILPAIIFIVGLITAVAGLVMLQIAKKRREADYDEWEDDEYES